CIPEQSTRVIDLMSPGIREREERLAERVPISHSFVERSEEAIVARGDCIGIRHYRAKGWGSCPLKVLESWVRIQDPLTGSHNHRVFVDLRGQLVGRASHVADLRRQALSDLSPQAKIVLIGIRRSHMRIYEIAGWIAERYKSRSDKVKIL